MDYKCKNFIFAGTILLFWGIKTLSAQSTYGLKGDVITSGSSKFTRNPQYLGDIFLFLGSKNLANTLLILITGILGIIWDFITTYYDEPWLKNLYGEKFGEYCKHVKRFL
ncbi:MAG: methyltransferase family protein [Candidatus Hodarchaeales archaeon]|jgi:protein-S-isoprenylcysteine O-methyltransferase Ste14